MRSFAVAQREEADFLAFHKFLDHQLDAPAAPKTFLTIASSMAAQASSIVRATVTPLPAARPSAFTTIGAPCRAHNSSRLRHR